MLRFSNFPKKDHALASYSAIFLLIGAVLTQLLPQFSLLGFTLTSHEASILALMASACGVIGGAIKRITAITLAATLSLVTQLLLLVVESRVTDGHVSHKWVLLVTVILAILSKLTVAQPPADPLATGSEAGSAPTVISPDSPHAPQK